MKINEGKRSAGYITAVLAGFVLLLGGCGGKQAEPSISDKALGQGGRPVAEIYQEITGAVTLASPALMDDDFIMNYYGIDSAQLEEYIFSVAEDAAQAETVIMMKAKDAGTLEELKACLQVLVEEKKNEMENYLPEQFAIVEKSSVQAKGNYVWLVISEQSDTILDIIEKNIAD